MSSLNEAENPYVPNQAANFKKHIDHQGLTDERPRKHQ
jgi:hypothetical protein